MRTRDIGFVALTAVLAAGLIYGGMHRGQRGAEDQGKGGDEKVSLAQAPAEKTGSATPESTDAMNGITRVKTAEGGLLVTALKIPKTSRDPRGFPDYSEGDWLVQNEGSEPAIITPYLEKDAYGADIQTEVIESLLVRDPQTFEWQPWLAESYEQKADGLTVIYKLRKEAMFSDGTPVTADDVVFSYKTMMDPKIDDDRYKSTGERIESCTKVDERTVAFKFREPFFQELEITGGIGVIPEHIYRYQTAEEFNKKTDLLVGSGPYVFEKSQWVRGQKIVLTRNPKYWGPKPPFDRWQYVFIQNPTAAFQAFENGDIDEFAPDPEQYRKFSQDAAFTAKYTVYKFDRPNSGYTYIGWNEKRPLFTDAKTRMALTMLTDRDTMIDTILYKLAHPISGPFSYMTKQADPSIKPVPFDARQARQLLTQAGWTLNAQNVLVRNGQEFRFNLMIPATSPTAQKIAEFIKNQYAKAGIIVTIAPYEFSVLVEKLDNRDYDASMLSWTGSIEEDPTQIWHSKSIENKGSNYISWSNPAADKLIEEGRREPDEAKRTEIWHKLHKVIADEQPYTFLWISSAREFIQPRIKNTAPYKSGFNYSDWFVPKGQQKYK